MFVYLHLHQMICLVFINTLVFSAYYQIRHFTKPTEDVCVTAI